MGWLAADCRPYGCGGGIWFLRWDNPSVSCADSSPIRGAEGVRRWNWLVGGDKLGYGWEEKENAGRELPAFGDG